jgi:hypothetical protein
LCHFRRDLKFEHFWFSVLASKVTPVALGQASKDTQVQAVRYKSTQKLRKYRLLKNKHVF